MAIWIPTYRILPSYVKTRRATNLLRELNGEILHTDPLEFNVFKATRAY